MCVCTYIYVHVCASMFYSIDYMYVPTFRQARCAGPKRLAWKQAASGDHAKYYPQPYIPQPKQGPGKLRIAFDSAFFG